MADERSHRVEGQAFEVLRSDGGCHQREIATQLPVVFIHGLRNSRSYWSDHLLSSLSGDRLVYDLRGHGDSQVRLRSP